MKNYQKQLGRLMLVGLFTLTGQNLLACGEGHCVGSDYHYTRWQGHPLAGKECVAAVQVNSPRCSEASGAEENDEVAKPYEATFFDDNYLIKPLLCYHYHGTLHCFPH